MGFGVYRSSNATARARPYGVEHEDVGGGDDLLFVLSGFVFTRLVFEGWRSITVGDENTACASSILPALFRAAASRVAVPQTFSETFLLSFRACSRLVTRRVEVELSRARAQQTDALVRQIVRRTQVRGRGRAQRAVTGVEVQAQARQPGRTTRHRTGETRAARVQAHRTSGLGERVGKTKSPSVQENRHSPDY